jgi:hypothetical protein
MKLCTFFVLLFAAAVNAQSGRTASTPGAMTTVCILVDHATEYSGKQVQIQARVISGPEFSILRDDSCPPKENPASGKSDLVLATYDEGRFDFNSPLRRKLSKILKRNRQAEITAAGSFIDPGKYTGHQLCCRYEFRIGELIAVKDVGKARP